MEQVELAVIGGSGLYNMAGLTDVVELPLETPYGKPSDAVMVGTLHGRRIAFLARHGRGHILNPSEVPYRANIYALKMLGAKYIIGINACGSLREHLAPGHIVIPDQLFDFTKGLRPHTFFEDGLVAHVSVADPFTPELCKAVGDAVSAVGGTVHHGGKFITIEGPRFSSKAESNTFRQWGMDIIGMTTCPEAWLAAEAQIAFVSMAHVTDYDVWHESAEPVTVEMVINTLRQNTQIAQAAIAHLVANFEDWAADFPVHTALKDAVLTQADALSAEATERLKLLLS